MNSENFGRQFQRLQDAYRKPDGTRWTGTDLSRATEGYIRPNYVTNLIKGRIERPGYDRLRAIAQVMGFPVELWFRELPDAPSGGPAEELPTRTLSEKLAAVFEAANRHRPPDEPLTSAQVAQLTFGRLSEQEIEDARAGNIEDLTGAQYLALSNVFGLPVRYWYTQDAAGIGPLEPDVAAAVRTRKGRQLLQKFHDRPEEQKDIILLLLDQLAGRDQDPQDD